MERLPILRTERGLMAKVAASLGLTRSAVAQWREVPANRVRQVAAVTGIPLHVLRPDLYEPPATSEAA